MSEYPEEYDYTASDLELLNSGAWNPEDDQDHEEEQYNFSDIQKSVEAPENPWEEPEKAEEYATQKTQQKPVVILNDEDIPRVELQPGGAKAAIEAILLIAQKPVRTRELSEALLLPEDAIDNALDQLYREYNGYVEQDIVHEPRGLELRRVAGGWRIYSRADFSPWVGRFIGSKANSKLPKAVMETLAVIAYQQPVTRAYITSVRGANADSAVRTLLQRELIVETTPEPHTRAQQYITTELFLEKLGLDSLDELPPLAPYLPDEDDLEIATKNF
ncbi:SMC-Scp complex subunit ScpB [Rothia sp. P7181]|uniref:SMC-Scp complex subunit ScpB n=1 Tax=unclassified Rothia (in: high G+C Gram-positive bacteria) TaxID=2689056 RepID=UPI003AD85BF1